MLRLSKKMMFSIEAVLDIAYHASGGPVQSRDITRRQEIPKRYLEQALQQLVRHGILIGVRGPKGGYSLARERRRVSIGDIMRSVQNIESSEESSSDIGGSELGSIVVRPVWNELQKGLFESMDAISIDDLCSRANEAGIESEGRKNLDFTI